MREGGAGGLRRGAPAPPPPFRCGKNHIPPVRSLTDARPGRRDNALTFHEGPERRDAVSSQGHASSSFALRKAIALLIAVAAAGLGTTAAVASGWAYMATGAA